MAARPKRDIFAEFYNALEETGEYCAFEIGRYSAGMSAPEWTHFRHQDCDGPRAFAKVLHARTSLEVDIGTSPNPPSFWTLFIAWIRLAFVDLRRKAPMRWRRFDRSWRPNPATRSRPPAMAWSLFSREETSRMAMLAKAKGVSLQSWLLWALKESIVPELVPGKGLVSWHVPVNMHGAFSSAENRGNSNFSLEVVFPPDADPTAVHKAIRQELRLRRHWVIAKWVFSFAWMITPWLLRQLVKLAALQRPWQGSFSSSGTVGYAEDAYGLEEWYIGLNPVVRASPLGACSCEWLGQLALSIQIHPSLTTDPQVARDWLKSWGKFAGGTSRVDAVLSDEAHVGAQAGAQVSKAVTTAV